MVPYHHNFHIWISKEVEEIFFKVTIWGHKACHKRKNQFLWERGVLSM